MDARTRLYTTALRLMALSAKLARIDATAAASGRVPGADFDALVRDARRATADLRAWTNAARMSHEVARARARFLSRA